MSNLASLNAAQPVECAPRAWIILGLVALVLEGTFAILSLAAVAFITSVFLTRRVALSVTALLLPRLGRSTLPQAPAVADRSPRLSVATARQLQPTRTRLIWVPETQQERGRFLFPVMGIGERLGAVIALARRAVAYPHW